MKKIKKGDLIFVYGTLRCGCSADLSQKPNNTFITNDRINGEMYNIGWFPGVQDVIPVEVAGFNEGQPTIKGEVFQVDADSLGVLLDLYEGYPDLYDRKQVSTETGLTVWVYTYNGDCSSKEHITGGDWTTRHNQQVVLKQQVA